MKRLDENKTIYLPPVRFYLEDLEHLLQLMSKNMMVVEIQHQNFSYESLDDLRINIQRESIDNLTLNARALTESPYASVSLNIEAGHVRISTFGNTSELKAVVAEFLRTRVKWYSWRAEGRWWDGLQGVLVVAVPMVALSLINVGFHPSPTAFFIITIMIMLLTGALLFGNRVWLGGSRIYLNSSVGSTTFWQRNGDKILGNAITGLVSAVIAFFAGYLSK